MEPPPGKLILDSQIKVIVNGQEKIVDAFVIMLPDKPTIEFWSKIPLVKIGEMTREEFLKTCYEALK